MTFHNAQDFGDALEAAAGHFKIRPVLIEKDYWVTYVLKKVSSSVHANDIVFKGGTSLSKAYRCIERFSEDIDLALIPAGRNDHQLNKIIKTVEKEITEGLTVIPGHEKEKKSGRNRTTIHKYPRAIKDTNFGVVKDYIQLEINTFTDPVPHQLLPIESYVAQFLRESGRQSYITEFDLASFHIHVLSLDRTFFEKLLSLNRLSYEGAPKLAEKIRHFYDLHELYHRTPLRDVIFTKQSFPIIDMVLKDDEKNETFKGAWKGKSLPDSPLFQNLESVWNGLIPQYNRELSNLVWTGDLPVPEAILDVMQKARDFVQQYKKN